MGAGKCAQGRGAPVREVEKRGRFLCSGTRGLAVAERGRLPRSGTLPATVAPVGSVLGWIVCPPKRDAGVLSPKTSACDFIWK